jgi:hypothetical protein
VQASSKHALGGANAGAEPLVSISNMAFQFTTYPAGPVPYAMAAGDFTGKGNLDVVAADFGGNLVNGRVTYNNTVGVLLNNGDGTFKPVQQYTVGTGPLSVAIGDFNGDGKLDLAVSSYESGATFADNVARLSILLGNGDGTFQSALITKLARPGKLAVGDFNGDGKLDLVMNDSYSPDGCQIAVLFGKGDGTFQSPVIVPVPDAANTVATNIVVADLRKNGKLDLVVPTTMGNNVGDSDDVVAILLGNGDGTFQPPVNYAVNTNPGPVAVADFDGDGKLDLAVSNICGTGGSYGNCEAPSTVSVLLGNGDGTFQSQNTWTVGYGGFSIATADVNGDGNLDLVVPNAYDSTLTILYGTGYGGFIEETYAYGNQAISLVAGQLSKGGAGSADMVLGNWNSYKGSTITAMLNEAGTHVTLASSPNPSNSGQAVTFTARVAASVTGAGSTPTGSVTFKDGSTVLGSASLVSGVATFSTSTLPAGTDSIVAAYSGDTNFNPNNATLVQTVTGGKQSFTLSASPTAVTVAQGASGTSTITVVPTGGFSGKVTLVASGLPTGVTAVFSPNPAVSTSTLTLTASATAATGTTTVTITGTSGSLSATTTIKLTVNPSTPGGFTLTALPKSLTVTQGKSGTSAITIKPTGGFSGNVALVATGLPTGVTAVFSPNPATTTSTLTLTVNATAATGTTTVTITGTSGSLSATTTIKLTVKTAPLGNFTLTALPKTLTVAQGSSGTSTITIKPTNGFAQKVILTASGLPTGVTASFSPTSVTPPTTTTSTLTLKVSSSAAVGATTITLTGTFGSLTHTTTVKLTVSQ